MTHDPYQMHPMIGAYSGLTNPFSSPYTAMQTSAINPALAYNPLTANSGLFWGTGQQQGLQGYPGSQGISPQQLQLAAALSAQSSQMFGLSPFTNALQNPFIAAAVQRDLIQNQLAANQLAAVAQQNPLLNPVLAAQLTGNLGQIGIGQQYQQPGFGQSFQQPGFGQSFQQPGFGQSFQQPGLGQLVQQHGFNPYQQQYQQQPYQQIPQTGWGVGQQQGNPYSQINNPFAQSTLAPQSWVGQGQQGQINPLLLQAVARGLQPNQGISPWGTF